MPRVTLDRTGDIAAVTLANLPLNLVHLEMIDELEAAVVDVANLQLRALMLCADGKNLSAGADVGRLLQGRSPD